MYYISKEEVPNIINMFIEGRNEKDNKRCTFTNKDKDVIKDVIDRYLPEFNISKRKLSEEEVIERMDYSFDKECSFELQAVDVFTNKKYWDGIHYIFIEYDLNDGNIFYIME